jgi:Putative transmembrane protein (PGPGW)
MMNKTDQARPFYKRVAIDIAGVSLIIAAPLLGWLPGPGGIPLFIAGLGLLSLNHEWAENLLKDFEKKRVEFTDKFLLASPKISFTIDIVGFILLGLGLYIATSQDSIIYRAVGLGIFSLTLLILFSNQKRFERISKKIKTLKKSS